MTSTTAGPRRTATALAAVATLAALTAGCGASATSDQHAGSATVSATVVAHKTSDAKVLALHDAMRELWAQHMEWTYATVAAYAAGTDGLPATLHRLLRNQNDIGSAIRPFYGRTAAHHLTQLLRTHIKDAVPVLDAAKAGDTAALGKAVKAWYANAARIADFLAKANPNWKRGEMRRMMKTHITQTIAYASDQLKGDYAMSIRDYGTAEAHMMTMADMLTDGLVAQFPHRFDRN